MHIDAAYAGAAAICPEMRTPFLGLEGASSFCFNPHKWLLVNTDCCAMWVACRAALPAALFQSSVYLDAAIPVVDFKDWQVPLSKRIR